MKHILHEEKATLNGVTIRLLRCRDESKERVGRTKNELVASHYDEKRSKYRDFVRMTVADTLPEAMPEFLAMSIKQLAILLPRFNDLERVQRGDCVTVNSFPRFA